jgi:hypothetical protein
MRPRATRERAIEAWRLLNDIVLDLLVGSRALELFDSPGWSRRIHAGTAIGFRRMALFHIIITLSKWADFYGSYGDLLPKEVQVACRELKRSIDRRGIRKFRNSVVGHIFDREERRPLTREEVEARVIKVLGGDPETFLRWLNDPKSNEFPSTFISVCESARRSIEEEHGVSRTEALA